MIGGVIGAVSFMLMELAWITGFRFIDGMQEVINVLLKVAGHYRWRDGRVTDDFAGKDRDIFTAEDLIQVVEVIDRVKIAFGIRRVDAELLVAVDEIDQWITGCFIPA
jgi:hypothetical protein